MTTKNKNKCYITPETEYLLARNERLYRLLGYRARSFGVGIGGDFDATGAWANLDEVMCVALDNLAKKLHPEWANDHKMQLAYDRRLSAEEKNARLAKAELHRAFGKESRWFLFNPLRKRAAAIVCDMEIASGFHATTSGVLRELKKIAKDVRSRHSQ